MRWAALIAVILLVATIALGAPGDAADALKKADQQFCTDTRAKGLEGWLSWFADSATIPQADPPASGKPALREFYKDLFAHPDLDFSWTPDHSQLFPNGRLGYTSGRFRMSFTGKDGKKANRIGSYLTVWQKQEDGRWKVLSDFGAPDGPPQ